MNSLIKEAEVLIEYETCKIITNVNINKVIKTLISHRVVFSIPLHLTLSHENICNILNEFKDENTMFKIYDNEVMTVKKNIPYYYYKHPIAYNTHLKLSMIKFKSDNLISVAVKIISGLNYATTYIFSMLYDCEKNEIVDDENFC